MFRVQATVDVESVIQMLNDCHPVATGAAASALNKAAAKARTLATRDIAAEYGVTPQRIIRRRMRLWKASRKSLAVRLRFMLRGIPTVLLKRKPPADSWKMKSKKGTQREHIFRRESAKRLPIHAQYVHPLKSFCQYRMWWHLTQQAPTVAAEIERQILHRMNGAIGPSRHELAKPVREWTDQVRESPL